MPSLKKKRGLSQASEQQLLYEAAIEGDAAAVARLLAAGADPNASVPGTQNETTGEPVQTTPLGQAAVRGRVEAVRLLDKAGADPDRTEVDATGP